jgi:hypothetical protein
MKKRIREKVVQIDSLRADKLEMEWDTGNKEAAEKPVELRSVVVTIPQSQVQYLTDVGLLGKDQDGNDIVELISFCTYGALSLISAEKKKMRKLALRILIGIVVVFVVDAILVYL